MIYWLAVLLTVFSLGADMANARRIEVQGHRGARGAFPENTLPAFKHALEIGVDVLELDLGVTKDDVLVVTHDLHLNPDICLDPKGKKIEKEIPVRSLTLAQLQRYDCGSLQNPRFPNQKPVPGTQIPTLESVFELVKSSELPAAKTVQFNIETKIVPAGTDLSPTPKKFAALLLKVLQKHDMVQRSIVQSFDHRVLAFIREGNPDVRLSALISGNYIDHVLLGKKLGAHVISPDFRWITRDSVKALQKEGMRVAPYTANDKKEWDYLVKLGVDSIITDYPEELIKYLKRRRLRK